MGCPAPSFIASSISAADAWPFSNMRIAWHRYGTRSVHDEAGPVLAVHDPLPEHVACERAGSGLDIVGGALCRDDLDELHDRRRVEEVHPDDLFGPTRHHRDLDDRVRRRIRGDDRAGPRMLSSSAKISFLSSRFSGAASMTRSHGARSARSVVQVMLATAASRAASSSLPARRPWPSNLRPCPDRPPRRQR